MKGMKQTLKKCRLFCHNWKFLSHDSLRLKLQRPQIFNTKTRRAKRPIRRWMFRRMLSSGPKVHVPGQAQKSLLRSLMISVKHCKGRLIFEKHAELWQYCLLHKVFQALEGTTISKDQKFNKCTEFNTGKDDERGNLPKVCLSLRLQSAYNIFKFLCNNRPWFFLLWKLTRILQKYDKIRRPAPQSSTWLLTKVQENVKLKNLKKLFHLFRGSYMVSVVRELLLKQKITDRLSAWRGGGGGQLNSKLL